MKLDTMVWIRCESKGRPVHTIQNQCTIRDCVMLIAKWLHESYMGSHMEIRIARSEADLNRAKRNADLDAMQNELESLLGGTPDDSQTELELGE